MVVKALHVKQGDLFGTGTEFMRKLRRRAVRAGVRAFIVVLKRGNSRGAKGRRKVDT